jgi:glycosyltransferase involved in cell wall biosynthesis
MVKVIMLLTNPFQPDPRVYNIARVLLENNYRVTIFAWDREGRYPKSEEIDGIYIKRPSLKSTYSKGLRQLFAFVIFQIKALIFLLKNDFDIVHPNDFDTLMAAFLAAKLRRKKIVYDCHEDYPAMMKDRKLRFLSTIIDKIQTFIIKRVNLTLVVTPAFEKAFREKGIKKIKLVLNCKSVDDYIIEAEKMRDLRKKLDAEGKFVFLYIGRIAPDRNLEELVEIFKQIQNPYILFVIGGDGVLEEKIKSDIASSKSIKFIGTIHPSLVPLYTKMADAMLAIYSEKNLNNVRSVPNKIFEAIAAAKPIIASKYGLIGQIINETRCGVAVNPSDLNEIKDAIIKISSDKETYRFIIESTLKIQRKYDWKIVGQELIQEYNRVAIGSSR